MQVGDRSCQTTRSSVGAFHGMNESQAWAREHGGSDLPWWTKRGALSLTCSCKKGNDKTGSIKASKARAGGQNVLLLGCPVSDRCARPHCRVAGLND